MTALLSLSLALLGGQLVQPDTPVLKAMELDGLNGFAKRLVVEVSLEKLSKSKLSPKQGWVFEWVSAGLAKVKADSSQTNLRFRVFEQYRDSKEVGPQMTRMLLRLWDFNMQKLGLDHPEDTSMRTVDAYLAAGGKPGGEQKRDVDYTDRDGLGLPRRVNTIYIYDIQSFSDPLEMAREVAHEYGHATLPPVGGFKEPEDWANGFLGERLYLTWLRREIAAKHLTPRDAMGVELTALDRYIESMVTPLVKRVALNGPSEELLAGTSANSMNEYLGLAMYAEALLPTKMFAWSLLLGTETAPNYEKAVVDAAAERPSWTVTVPSCVSGKAIWIPLGKGKLSGGKVLARKGDWAKIAPSGGALTVTNPKVGD